MIELGKIQELEVLREKEFGVYLGEKQDAEASVLLPKKQVPEGTKTGDTIRVFIYKDSEDRLIATTAMPKLQVGETALLKVNDVSKSERFWTWGWRRMCCFLLRSRTTRSESERNAWLPFMWTRAAAWRQQRRFIRI